MQCGCSQVTHHAAISCREAVQYPPKEHNAAVKHRSEPVTIQYQTRIATFRGSTWPSDRLSTMP